MEYNWYYNYPKNWTIEDYDHLNSFLTKIFEYRERDYNIKRLKTMNLNCMVHSTKAIMKAVILTLDIMDEIIETYPNLTSIKDVKPMKEPLYLSQEPLNVFPAYKEMNIII